MLKPPVLPQAVLTGGKIAVTLTWIFCAVAIAMPLHPAVLNTLGLWIAIVMVVSHFIEIFIFREFFKAAKATPTDYVMALVFGMFHTGGLKT